jgi:hypothetical protein
MSDLAVRPDSHLASFIERASRDEDFSIDKFEALLRMQKEVEHDQARKAFNRAMAAAQAEMLPIVRDAKNSHLNNRYAKLETIDAAIRPIYTRHGFSVRYGSSPSPHEGWMRITCTVAHDSGYFEENYLDAPVSLTGSQGGKLAVTPVQAIGSTVTYLRRYLLGMVWNAVLSDDDDDGEGTRRDRQRPPPPPPPPTREMATNGNSHKRTLRNVLDAIKIAVRDASTEDDLDSLARTDDYRKVMASAPESAQKEITDAVTQRLADIRRDVAEQLGESGWAPDVPIENDPSLGGVVPDELATPPDMLAQQVAECIRSLANAKTLQTLNKLAESLTVTAIMVDADRAKRPELARSIVEAADARRAVLRAGGG